MRTVTDDRDALWYITGRSRNRWLEDTVDSYNPITKQGTGFGFQEFSPFYLMNALKQGIELYQSDQETWTVLVKQAMEKISAGIKVQIFISSCIILSKFDCFKTEESLSATELLVV